MTLKRSDECLKLDKVCFLFLRTKDTGISLRKTDGKWKKWALSRER